MAGANANYFDKYDQPVVAQKPVAPTNYFDKYDQPVASPVAPQVVAGQSTPPLAVVRPAPKPNIDTMLPLPKAGPTQKQEPEGGLLQDAVAGYKSSPRQQFDEQDLNPLRPLAQGVDEFLKDSQAGVDMMKSGANRFATSDPGSLERLASAPEMVMGALGYAASPFTGAVRGLVTNPVAKATGLPTSYVDIAAQGVVGAEFPGMRKTPTLREATGARIKQMNPALKKLDVSVDTPEQRASDLHIAADAGSAGPVVLHYLNNQDMLKTHSIDMVNFRTRDALAPDQNLPVWHDSVNSVVQDFAKKLGMENVVKLIIGDDGTSANALDKKPDGFMGSFSEDGALGARGADSKYIALVLNSALNPAKALEIALHEFGHAVDYHLLEKDPQAHTAVRAAYDNQAKTLKFNDLSQRQHRPISIDGNATIDAPNPLNPGGKTLADAPISVFSKRGRDYVKSFVEWKAEQVSRWLTTDKKPLGVVERYFKGAADRWKAIYQRVTGHVPLADEVRDFMVGKWRDDEFLRQRNADTYDMALDGSTTVRGGFSASSTFGTPPGAPPRAPPGAPPNPPPGGSPGNPSAPMATPLGQAPRTRTPIAPQPTNWLHQVAKKVEQIFSPSSVDQYSRRAEAQIREETGIAARDTEAFKASMDEFHAQLGAASPEQKRGFMAYMQGDATSAVLPDPRMQPIADALKTSFDKIKNEMVKFDRIEDMNFIENYFPQMWKDPVAARQFFGTAAKQGRTGFTKKRIFETIEDGLAAGLELKHDNPIDTAIEYMTNAHNFIGTERIFQDARDARTVRYVAPGKIPAGWLPVNGRLGEKTIPGTGLRRIAVAPEGWARRYNNHISKSLDGPGGDAIEGFRKTANGITALELGMSAYHAFTSISESMHNVLARATDKLSYGKPLSALGTLAKYPVAGILDYRTGARGKRESLRPGSTDPRTAYLVDVITRSGGRMAQVEDYYATSGRRGYLKGSKGVVDALKLGDISSAFRGTADMIKRTGREIGEDFTKNMGARPLTGALQGVFRVTANVLDTTMAPLFKDIIPKLKNGAAMENLSAWLDAHPEASDMDVLRAGREIWDSIDNRFGEMVQDNVGYNRVAKDVLQSAFRSWSYVLGQNAREYGGAIADTLTMPMRYGKSTVGTKATWTTKQSYLLTTLVHMSAMATIGGLLMTGKLPSDWMDLRAPKTGGKTPTGQPERANIPGSFKELFNVVEEGPVTVASRKIGTLPTMLYEVMTNKDWKNDPILHSTSGGAPQLIEDFGNYMVSKLGPFSLKNALAGPKKGSAITPAMSLMGVQPSGSRLTDPKRADHFRDKREREAWRKKDKYERKDRELRK